MAPACISRPAHLAPVEDLRGSHTPMLRRPRESGDPGAVSRNQIVGKVAPLRIMALDQSELPGASPLLDALFANDGVFHGLVEFDKNQSMDAVAPGEPTGDARPMRRDSVGDIAGHTGIKSSVAPAREKVDARLFLGHVHAAPGSPPSRGRRETSHTMSRCLYLVATDRAKGKHLAAIPCLASPLVKKGEGGVGKMRFGGRQLLRGDAHGG
jgi:hypothetical protein